MGKNWSAAIRNGTEPIIMATATVKTKKTRKGTKGGR